MCPSSLNIVSSWPDFETPYADSFGLKARCATGHFICAIETNPDQLLLVYETHGCFVTTTGQLIPSQRIHEWALTVKAATYCDQYIALLNENGVEIRDARDGSPLQILNLPKLILLYPTLSYSSNESVLVAIDQRESGAGNVLGELLPTTIIASPLGPTLA